MASVTNGLPQEQPPLPGAPTGTAFLFAWGILLLLVGGLATAFTLWRLWACLFGPFDALLGSNQLHSEQALERAELLKQHVEAVQAVKREDVAIQLPLLQNKYERDQTTLRQQHDQRAEKELPRWRWIETSMMCGLLAFSLLALGQGWRSLRHASKAPQRL